MIGLEYFIAEIIWVYIWLVLNKNTDTYVRFVEKNIENLYTLFSAHNYLPLVNIIFVSKYKCTVFNNFQDFQKWCAQ